jgi:hypothetical protein
MRRVLALVVLSALTASCGGNAEDVKLFQQRRDICNGLNTKGETVGQVKADFQATGLNGPTEFIGTSCQSDFVLPDKSSCQAGQSYCKIYWQTIALDGSLCNVNRCVYACVGFVPGQGQSDITDSTTVCGTIFISGQPFLF